MTTSRAVIVIFFLNLAVVIIAGGESDQRVWWVVLGIAIVSAVCLAALVIARRSARTKGRRS